MNNFKRFLEKNKIRANAINKGNSSFIINGYNSTIIKNNDNEKYNVVSSEVMFSVIKKYLTDDIKYYDDDTLTNTSVRFIIGELVREKILNLTNDEVPHSVTCLTTLYEEKKDIININVDIIVDRDSLKKIIIGHNGQMIKNIGTYARRDIEAMLHKQIYLELYVKTIKNWRDKEKYLTELGFKDY